MSKKNRSNAEESKPNEPILSKQVKGLGVEVPMLMFIGVIIGIIVCIYFLLGRPFFTDPLIGNAVRATVQSMPGSTAAPTATPLVKNPAATDPSAAMVASSPACPYAGQSDDDTMRALIKAEAEAVNSRSSDMVVAIFAPEALFEDYAQNGSNGAPPKTWNGPLARYQEDLFQNMEMKDAQNVDITPAGLSVDGKSAWYVSGSRGFYKSEGSWYEFNNGSLTGDNKTQYGSNHWTLQRKPDGCWAISRFAFNAGHIPFPP